MSEIIPLGTEEQDEVVPALHSQGLRSRGPAVLPKAKSACQSVMVEGAVVAE